LRDVDLVFLSTPIGAIIDYLPRVAACIDQSAIVTDVGSTKAVIVDEARRVMAGHGYFIGGHPLAGSERSGWEQANVDLFNNTTYVLTPLLPVPAQKHQGLVALLQMLGAHVVEMDAETHDRVVAQISHLPQLLAVALMNYVGRDDADKNLRLMLAAGGLRDMTRIAGASFHIWKDILRTNKKDIKKFLQEFRENLSTFETLVDNDAMETKFSAAKLTKQEIDK
jgi:prephenate dehydrogenase